MAITTPRERLKLLRPAPVALLATALLGVALPLQAQPVDVLCLQEIAQGGGDLTRRIDIQGMPGSWIAR